MGQLQLVLITVKISSLCACFALIHGNSGDTGAGKSIPSTAVASEEIQDVPPPRLEISASPNATRVKIGERITLTCNILPADEGRNISWSKNGQDMDNPVEVVMNSKNNTGTYTCMAAAPTNGTSLVETIEIELIPEPGKITGGSKVFANLNDSGVLSCEGEGYPLENFKWSKINDTGKGEDLANLTIVTWNGTTHFTMTLNLPNITRENNGTYKCSVDASNGVISSEGHLLITEVPEVEITFIKAVETKRVYLRWIVNERNDPVENCTIEYRKDGTQKWTQCPDEIGGGNFSHVLDGLENATAYRFRITATNSIGESQASEYPRPITTLKYDPKWTPRVIKVESTDTDSIIITWSKPPEQKQDYFHYYQIEATFDGRTEVYKCPVEPSNIYKFLNLESDAHRYRFRIAACSKFTKKCGEWSRRTADILYYHDDSVFWRDEHDRTYPKSNGISEQSCIG